MKVGELLAARAAVDMVGREKELVALRRLLDADGPRVVHVHGIPGIGKSTLLRAFAREARAAGAVMLELDCREVEPTPEGFAGVLARTGNLEPAEPERLCERLGHAGSVVVLALDGFEAFRLLDPWLRLTFLPALPDNVRVVLAGRYRPAVGWSFDGWEGLVLSLPLAPLDIEDAVSVLESAVPDPAQCRRIAAALHGHPLALRLAASVLAGQPDLELPDATLHRVMSELTPIYLAEVEDERTRRLLEGASVVRRVTAPVLASMFDDSDQEEAYHRLERLAFTEATRDGLRLHDGVRDAIALTLRARNPERHLHYRREAWRVLARQASAAGQPELWRYTADMLYLIENPVVREAFFPSGTSLVAVEGARPADGTDIRDIAAAHEGPAAADCLLRWWARHPETFVAVRGTGGGCDGFCCYFDPAAVDGETLVGDPVTADWLSHLEAEPLPDGKRALFIRRWLDREDGERPGEGQAACWIDLKRTYMEMRPKLRRVYLTLADVGPYAAVARELGFRPLEDHAVTLDGRTYHTAVLDFGPGSVDGWLAGLAAAELGIRPEDHILDREARELVLDGRRIGLTPLEFGVMAYLCDCPDRAVAREELLREVWRTEYTGWSNKVDAVIAGLRHKLGRHARRIQTVTGVGYRYGRSNASREGG
jgi:hypothetical protein